MPAVIVPLIAGAHYGYPGTGVLMAGGAMCVGFGSFQKPLVWRWGPMLAAAVGIAISGAVGTVLHERIFAFGAVVVLWAFVYGLSNAMGTAAAWVGLQCCVYLVISAAAPHSLGGPKDDLLQGLARGGGLLAGALLQMFWIVLMWRWVPRAASTFTDPEFDPAVLRLRHLRNEVRAGSIWFRFAIRISVTVAIAVAVFHFVKFNNAYWIPMTALLLPRPQFMETMVRTALRLGGTVEGALLCTLLIVLVHPAGETLSVWVAVFLFATYCLMYVNYGAFAVFLTGYIVFILAIVKVPQREVILHRVEATLIGGAIALAVHAVFYLLPWKVEASESRN
ncbi:MAG: FUSC family protein [Acidobacteria bacterium]|nr:FUSC family protein [Acidobacteriota bacterium]